MTIRDLSAAYLTCREKVAHSGVMLADEAPYCFAPQLGLVELRHVSGAWKFGKAASPKQRQHGTRSSGRH